MAAEHVYQPVGDPPRGFQARADYPEPLRVYETRGALCVSFQPRFRFRLEGLGVEFALFEKI